MPASPSILNYYIGKGDVYVQLAGESEYRHVGNVPTFEWTPEIEQEDHFSSRSGVRSKDRTVVTLKGGQVSMEIEEYTPENLALAVLGDVLGTNTDGDIDVSILSNDGIEGAMIKFVGNNDIGPKIQFEFFSCSIIPDASIGLISESWSSFTLNAETLEHATLGYGKATILSEEATA